MLQGHRRNEGLMSDYCDGTNFQTNPLFLTQSCAIQLMIYYDELEVCNPLGSKTKTKYFL